MVSNGGVVSNIIDGDIPCTPDKEPSFGFVITNFLFKLSKVLSYFLY